MFHECDKYAEMLFRYFSNLGKTHLNSLKTEENEHILDLFHFWKKSFYQQTLDHFKKSFILFWKIITGKIPTIQPLIQFFINIMNSDAAEILPKDLQPDDIRAGVILAIVFKNNSYFDKLVPLIMIDIDIIKIIYSEGNLGMYQTVSKYYSTKSLLSCLEDHGHYHDLENISDLDLLKFMIQQGANKKRLSYLSLITATDKKNYLLLVYLLRDIRVHQQSSNHWHPSAFSRALDTKDEIILHLLIKSGAFSISEEINDKLENIIKKSQKLCATKSDNDCEDSSTSSDDDEEFYNFCIKSYKSEIDTLIRIFSNDRVELNRIKQTIIIMMQKEKISLSSKDYLQSLFAKISPPSLKDLCINKLALYTHSIETNELIESNGLTAKLNNATLLQSLNVPDGHKPDPLPKKRSYEMGRLFSQPSEEAKINENAQAESSKKLCCRIL